MRQSIDNLHDSITEDVLAAKRIVVDVIDPSPGVYGGEPMEGLVTVVYQCEDEWCRSAGCRCTHKQPETGHAHHALYGPADERVPTRGVTRYSLYAD